MSMSKFASIFLKEPINTDNVRFVCLSTNLCDIKQLRLVCAKIIGEEAADAIMSDNFLQFSCNGSQYILNLDAFRYPERYVFSPCVERAQEQCKKNGSE